MKTYYYHLILIVTLCLAWKKDSAANINSGVFHNAPAGVDVAAVLYATKLIHNVTIKDDVAGGTFVYRPASSKVIVDKAITFHAKNGGYWERQVDDTVKLAWFNLSAKIADNAANIDKGIRAAIEKRAAVVMFPSGTYKVARRNYWTVPDNVNLQVNGNGAIIEIAKEAANVAQETYVMAFRCENLNSTASRISVKNLVIKAPGILPQWTNKNYNEHKLVIAIETDGINDVNISNCKLNDICGYGIRLKNFITARVDKVMETNVGGHFPVENQFDSFGDGLWLGHYDVQTARPSRKNSSATISNCTIRAYNTATNGNFASRCGITVEGFNSHGRDIVMKVNVSNTEISDYDRNVHVEGISALVNYTDCTLRNFFGLGLVASSPYTSLTYNNCTASELLTPNAAQERYGLGGIMQFNSTLDVYMTNRSIFTFNGSASFRANLHIQNGSILDFGNSDVFFDHANLFVNTGGSMINIPAKVNRGFNMYGGNIDFNGALIKGSSKNRGEKGVFHGESIDKATLKNNRLDNSRLLFNGASGYILKE